MFQGDPERIAQDCNHHMSFDAEFELMKQGPEYVIRMGLAQNKP
jgi:hypothetical protein